jgi:amidohydrolase
MDDLLNHNNDLIKEMISWRHEIHQYPELGFKEHKTSKKVVKLLLNFGVDVYKGIGKTGIIGILKCGNSSGSIGLRAHMDALSIHEENTFSHKSKNDGRMHACGHDGHTTMILGAAK